MVLHCCNLFERGKDSHINEHMINELDITLLLNQTDELQRNEC
jgi:hypothetical protein